MTTLKIHETINTRNAILHKFGLIVYSEVKAFIESGEKVTLSFNGLKNVTSGFCNASIGKLYSDCPNVKDFLFIEGVDQNPIWKEKVENAIALAEKPNIVEIRNNAISDLLTS